MFPRHRELAGFRHEKYGTSGFSVGTSCLALRFGSGVLLEVNRREGFKKQVVTVYCCALSNRRHRAGGPCRQAGGLSKH